LHDTIDDVVNELVDRVADAGRCDVVTDIARPYPMPRSLPIEFSAAR
jgi:cytochrome P450